MGGGYLVHTQQYSWFCAQDPDEPGSAACAKVQFLLALPLCIHGYLPAKLALGPSSFLSVEQRGESTSGWFAVRQTFILTSPGPFWHVAVPPLS